MVNECESCGMPMEKDEDFGGNDPKNKYCKHCTFPDGELKPYEEVLKGMSNHMVETQGISLEEARKKAREYLKTMPAWKDR